MTPGSTLHLQFTCSWVWWCCTSCCAPSTRWPTCTAWPPSCSCRAARTPCWRRTGRPSWTPTRRLLPTPKTKRPASPWVRSPTSRTTPSTRAELGGGENRSSTSAHPTPGSVGWIFFFYDYSRKHPGKKKLWNKVRSVLESVSSSTAVKFTNCRIAHSEFRPTAFEKSYFGIIVFFCLFLWNECGFVRLTSIVLFLAELVLFKSIPGHSVVLKALYLLLDDINQRMVT